jgi:hypothetical protein
MEGRRRGLLAAAPATLRLRSGGRLMKAMFTIYLTVIGVGLVYFAALGLLGR